MKIFLKLLVVTLGITISTSIFAQTQNLGDLIDSLGSEITFGYNSNQKIIIKEITNDKATIQSPIIKNQAGSNITKYTVMYSEYPLTDILEKTDLLNQTKEKTFELTGTTDPFTMDLGTIDNLDITKTYYIFVIPKDSNGTLGEVSNELRFKLSDKSFGEGTSTGNIASLQTTNEVHNAPGADMSLANITHTVDGNTITLKWTAVAGSNTIDIAVLDPTTNTFNRIATVNMRDESYKYITNRNGEFIFQITPDSNGKSVNYTATINGVKTTNTVQIKKVPRTGPAENTIAIILIAFVFYFGYKKLYRKAK